ncbi:hypothetical protein B0A49_10890 [Cryomyces minteri]|uniref:Uncharacterized protein n=1 Tax=Cryomyces minteri TaxID=331657 RepID=A0A4U0WAS1_9PEZI|nr:hypothetical protein B0A49_10890 [Cryomyces minteri]
MGISYSTARYLAPASFIYNFLTNQYGLAIHDPTMKQVHDSNLSFFSPQPYFIGGFFFPQQIIQLIWIYRMWKLNPKKSDAERKELDQIVDYAPYYALGNFCIGTWMFFWCNEQLKISNAFVVVNTLSQLFYIATKLGPMNTQSPSSVLTHVVSKTFAGIGVLDLLHNTSIAYFKDEAPSMLVKVGTGLGFGLLSASSDWIFGGCMVYDLVALAVGQSGSWRQLLSLYAMGSAAIVGAKNYAIPPYESRREDYTLTSQQDSLTAQEDVNDRV